MRSKAVLSVVVLALGADACRAQTVGAGLPPGVKRDAANYPDRQHILEQVKVCEDALRDAEAAHAAPGTLAKIDVLLGGLYQDAGSYAQSEAAFDHAIVLLRDAPPQEMANALDGLAILHALTGETRKAEREAAQAVTLYGKAGDAKEAALAQLDLSNSEAKGKHYGKAVDDARAAMQALDADAAVGPGDSILAHQALGYALAEARRCSEAIPELKGTLELAKSSLGEASLMVGVDSFLLGHSAWQCGDSADAAGWMQSGIERMKVDLGWGHVVYLYAVSEYAKFLRERGQTELAEAEEREVKMAQSTVDVRALAPVSGLR